MSHPLTFAERAALLHVLWPFDYDGRSEDFKEHAATCEQLVEAGCLFRLPTGIKPPPYRVTREGREALKANETPIKKGQRVVLVQDCERYPHGVAPKGAHGVIEDVQDDLFWVKLDETVPGFEEWENSLEIEFDGYEQFYIGKEES